MSSDETQSALSRAFELVENGNYEEARMILDPILQKDKNNANAWWIYAHAATDPDVGREALENVLRIDPTYPGASELIAIARERYAPQTETPVAAALPASMPEAPPSLPEAEFAAPERRIPASAAPADTQENPVVKSRSGSGIVPLLAIAAVVVVVVILLLLLLPGGGTESPTPTEAAVDVEATSLAMLPATEEITPEILPLPLETSISEAATMEIVATEASTRPPTVTPTFTLEPGATEEAAAESTDFGTIAAVLSQFPLTENGLGVVESGLGNTLQANVCTTPGREMRTLLPQVMNALARESTSVDSSVEAIGVQLINCADNIDLLRVAVDRASALAYAEGNLTDAEFTKLWQPQ